MLPSARKSAPLSGDCSEFIGEHCLQRHGGGYMIWPVAIVGGADAVGETQRAVEFFIQLIVEPDFRHIKRCHGFIAHHVESPKIHGLQIRSFIIAFPCKKSVIFMTERKRSSPAIPRYVGSRLDRKT